MKALRDALPWLVIGPFLAIILLWAVVLIGVFVLMDLVESLFEKPNDPRPQKQNHAPTR